MGGGGREASANGRGLTPVKVLGERGNLGQKSLTLYCPSMQVLSNPAGVAQCRAPYRGGLPRKLGCGVDPMLVQRAGAWAVSPLAEFQGCHPCFLANDKALLFYKRDSI